MWKNSVPLRTGFVKLWKERASVAYWTTKGFSLHQISLCTPLNAILHSKTSLIFHWLEIDIFHEMVTNVQANNKKIVLTMYKYSAISHICRSYISVMKIWANVVKFLLQWICPYFLFMVKCLSVMSKAGIFYRTFRSNFNTWEIRTLYQFS